MGPTHPRCWLRLAPGRVRLWLVRPCTGPSHLPCYSILLRPLSSCADQSTEDPLPHCSPPPPGRCLSLAAAGCSPAGCSILGGDAAEDPLWVCAHAAADRLGLQGLFREMEGRGEALPPSAGSQEARAAARQRVARRGGTAAPPHISRAQGRVRRQRDRGSAEEEAPDDEVAE